MKTLVISDIHANLIALETVWKRESDADLILCIGDIVDYGIYPVECVEWMMEKKALAVRGNHDDLVVAAAERPAEHAPDTWRTDNAGKLSPRHLAYLKDLPLQRVVELDGIPYGLTHAYQGYEIIRSLEEFQRFGEERFGQSLQRMIFGHTHRRSITFLSDEDCWINPGSLSYRRTDERWRGAHYAVIQDGNISLRGIPYPTEQLHREVLASTVCQSEKEVTYPWWFPERNPLESGA
ncbi:MAG: metallophosphoesterase family protein [Opitutales bacterium]|nr:metallophosphoesterase family protein [Opitutales bacterium]